MAAVKSLFSFGHRLGYLPFDVGRAVKQPRLKDTLAERILTEGDVQRLLALEPGRRNQVLLRLLYIAEIGSQANGLAFYTRPRASTAQGVQQLSPQRAR